MLLQAFEASTDHEIAAVTEEFIPRSFEHMLSEIALRLFPTSQEIESIETELFHGRRCATVLEAERWIRKTLARYVRLCIRRKWNFSIGDTRFSTIILSSVPKVVEEEYRRHHDLATAQQMFPILNRIGSTLKRRTGELPQPAGPVPVFALEQKRRHEPNEQSAQRRKISRVPPYPCRGCGEMHYRNECPSKNMRCKNCLEIGHIQAACRAKVDRDDLGRVRFKAVADSAKTQAVTFRDRTAADKTATAAQVLELIRSNIARRNERRKTRATTSTPFQPRKEHPVGAIQSVNDNCEDQPSSSSGDDDEELANLISEVSLWWTTSNLVPVDVVIRNVRLPAMADTGSKFSLMSRSTAQELGLTVTSEQQTFKGLGTAVGRKSSPTTIQFPNGATVVDSVYVLEAQIPVIVGVDLLGRAGAVIDCANHRIDFPSRSSACAGMMSRPSKPSRPTWTLSPV